MPLSIRSLGVLVTLLSLAPAALAVEPVPSNRESVADGIDGLPGLYRIGVPATPAPRFGTSLWGHYGYTEPQNGAPGAHHRVGGTLALGGALFPHVEAALRMDLRHDIHEGDATDPDGTLIDFSPILRAGVEVVPRVRIGAEGRLWFPGAAARGGVPDPSVDARLLGAGQLGKATLSVLAGYRTGVGGQILTDAAQLSPGDRISLGVSQYGALLLGLGALYDFGRTEVLTELTWDVSVGDGAPPALQSPLRLGAGVRYRIVEGVALHGQVEVLLSERAPSEPGDPLVPIEPRFLALVGASVRLPDLVRREPAPPPPPSEEPKEPVVETSELPPPTLGRASLRVTVVDETGHPISDAKVTVEVPATLDRAAETLELPLEQVNLYTVSEVPAGEVDLVVEAELLQSYTQHLTLEPDQTGEVRVRLQKAAGVGTQLRGLVRDYSGTGLAASIRLVPGGLETRCSEQGEFVVDLAPGVYDVIIELEGYVTQKRRLRVRKEGVTVLNADLQTAR